MGYRTTSDYAVVCDLGVQHFDSPRAGIAMARAAYGEMRRLGTTDERVRSTRWRRSSRETVQLTITVRAHDAHRAFEVAGGLLRTGIHAVGGSTAGWEQLHPRVEPEHRARRGPRRRVPVPESGASLASHRTWDDWSSLAQRRVERGAQLPAFGGQPDTAADPIVIDLR